MKKVFKFFAAALAIVAAASCAKELSDNNTTQTPDQELVHKVFSASLNVDSDTKTTLHTDGVSVHWTEDDVIKVLPAGSATGTDFSVVSYNGTFADFEGETVDADSHRAVYPASAYHNSSSSDVFVFSNGIGALNLQYAVENNFSIAANFNASSNFAVSSSSQDDHLFFNNINAYLKFNLSMDNAFVIEVSSSRATGFQNEMLSSSKDLGGVLKYDVKKKISWVDSNEIITFKNADGSDLKSGVNYYVAIPAVEIENLNVVIKDKEGRKINSFTRSKTLDALANNIYNLGTLEAAPAPEPAKVGDYFYSDGTYSTALDNSNSKTVVGVVFYIGDPTESDPILARDYPSCSNGLVLGLFESQSAFGNYRIDGAYSNSLYDGNFGISKYGAVLSDTAPTGYGLTLAYGNYRENIKSSSGYENSCILFDVNDGVASKYNRSSQISTSASSWYIPSRFEMNALYENKELINSKLANVGGVLIGSTRYWSSYVYSKKLHGTGNYHDCFAYPIDMNTGDWITNAQNTTSYNVRAIFAF